MIKTYSEKLKDPRWQKKRLEIFERDRWSCLCCGRKDITLHVHHLIYFKETDPWEYKNEYLVTYCEYCHNTEHLIGDKLQESLIDVVKENRFMIKPVAQLCILIDNYEGFNVLLREFLNQSMISYLRMKNPPAHVEPNAKRLD